MTTFLECVMLIVLTFFALGIGVGIGMMIFALIELNRDK